MGGSWLDAGWEGATEDALAITLDRRMLKEDLVIELELLDTPGASLVVDLLTADGKPVREDLFGNLLTASGREMVLRYTLPLSRVKKAEVVLLRVVAGTCRIYHTSLFIDQDRDGLDASQELQLGTSDRTATGRRATASDWTATYLPGPRSEAPPATKSVSIAPMSLDEGGMAMAMGSTDTDLDGMPDDWETENGFNPNSGLNAGLVGWWTFDEGSGTNVYNSAGSGYTGQTWQMDGSNWVTGKLGTALSFDGVDEYVDIPQSAALITGTTFTVSCWINLHSFSSIRHMFLGYKYQKAWTLMIYKNTKRFSLYVGENGLWKAVGIDTADLTTNTWTHVAATYGDGWMSFYQDGVLTSTIAKDATMGETFGRNHLDNAGYIAGFDGEMHDFRVYD